MLVAGTIMMFLILVWEFARVAPAIACLIAAMSCLAGSFIALDVTGMTLNISSFMGIIMVAGITAKNGILLLDHAEGEVFGGAKPTAALLDAATVRLRPIMMTTLATAAGLFPLALGYGAGAKVQQPLAIAVIGGLAFAMFLSTPLAGGIYLMGTRSKGRSESSLAASASGLDDPRKQSVSDQTDVAAVSQDRRSDGFFLVDSPDHKRDRRRDQYNVAVARKRHRVANRKYQPSEVYGMTHPSKRTFGYDSSVRGQYTEAAAHVDASDLGKHHAEQLED